MVIIMTSFIYEKPIKYLAKRMDYQFLSPIKDSSLSDCVKSLKECLGENGLTASAFYPSIVPFYIDYDQHDKSEHIPFIRVSDARNGLLNFKKTVFLSYQLLKDINNIKIAKPKDLVITKGGEYIGETTLIPNTFEEYATCRDILLLRTNNSIVSSEYLASYLQSKRGLESVKKTASRQGQPHLTVDKVGDILIPIFDNDFQQNIEVLWQEHRELLEISEKSLKRALDIFDSYLNITHITELDRKSFSLLIERNVLIERMDYGFNNKRWDFLISELKKNGIQFKHIQQIKQTPDVEDKLKKYFYISISDVDDRTGVIRLNEELPLTKLPDRAKRLVKKDDVLVSSLKGSQDSVAIVRNNNNNIIATNGFYVIRDENFLPEYIYLIFRSNYQKIFMEQMATGGIMSAITDKFFKKFQIPVLEMKIQKELAVHINNHLENKQLAMNKLEKAREMFDLRIKE